LLFAIGTASIRGGKKHDPNRNPGLSHPWAFCGTDLPKMHQQIQMSGLVAIVRNVRKGVLSSAKTEVSELAAIRSDKRCCFGLCCVGLEANPEIPRRNSARFDFSLQY
jgi:hypothetical protein